MTSASTVEDELEKHTEIEEVECHNISNLVCYDVCLDKTLASKVALHVTKTKIQCHDCIMILRNDEIIKEMQRILEKIELEFTNFCHYTNLKQNVHFVIIREMDTTAFHCLNTKNAVIDTLAESFIKEWCNFMNKLIKGKIKIINNTHYIYYQAQKMSAKYTKNKSKKISINNTKLKLRA